MNTPSTRSRRQSSRSKHRRRHRSTFSQRLVRHLRRGRIIYWYAFVLISCMLAAAFWIYMVEYRPPYAPPE